MWKKCIGVLTRGCPVSYICRTIHSRPAGTAKLSTSGNASVSAFCELLFHLSTSFKPVVNNPVASVPVMPEVSKASACRIAPCPAANEYSHLLKIHYAIYSNSATVRAPLGGETTPSVRRRPETSTSASSMRRPGPQPESARRSRPAVQTEPARADRSATAVRCWVQNVLRPSPRPRSMRRPTSGDGCISRPQRGGPDGPLPKDGPSRPSSRLPGRMGKRPRRSLRRARFCPATPPERPACGPRCRSCV